MAIWPDLVCFGTNVCAVIYLRKPLVLRETTSVIPISEIRRAGATSAAIDAVQILLGSFLGPCRAL